MSNGATPPSADKCIMDFRPSSRMRSPASANLTPSTNSIPSPSPSTPDIGSTAPRWPEKIRPPTRTSTLTIKGRAMKKTNTTQNTDKNKNNNSGKSNSSNANTCSSNTNQKKPNPDLSSKLGKDGKLTQAERQRRFEQNLCLFCGKTGHIAKECSKATSAAAKAHSASATDKNSDAKSSTESKNP